MAIGETIHKLRIHANLSQEQFAEIFGVSRQSVQKWESNLSVPELEKLVKISKYFDLSLDTLVLSSDARMMEKLAVNKVLKPIYSGDSYASHLQTEYQQSIVEEGLDISVYADLFAAVSRLPHNEVKEKLGDILFDLVLQAPIIQDYPYNEPSTLPEIQQLRKSVSPIPFTDKENLEQKIHGAWMGRICGCMLGKTVECIRTNELIPFLQETGNYPMHRYILHSDLNDDICSKYQFRFAERCYADQIDGMPVDDDTNYVVLAQEIIEKHGREFTSDDVSKEWIALQSRDAYYTAERVAFHNFLQGYEPPESALYKNPFREWIGAQIRGDYFGYINPGQPEAAAEMAFRDACISHIKNGIYGEMFVAAMLAVAACTDDIKAIISGGLAQIPSTSRLYEAITDVISDYESGKSKADCFAKIHARYDEYSGHGWCHTISNAMVVAASLLYGEGDFGASICMAVETGFDTDCNGATVGSVLGMIRGIDGIDAVWKDPINDTLHTSIFGVGTVSIAQRARQTLQHIQ